MTCTIRHAAGAGAPDLALDILDSAGWTPEHDEDGNKAFRSPDGNLRVCWGPETRAYHSRGPLWTITYTPGADETPDGGWDASFGDNTPVELIAALLRDLVSGEPLDVDRAEFCPNPVPAP